MKIVIRAGGTGTRLWPLSRQNNPKQFQKIVSDKTMLQETFERIKPLLSSPQDLFVSVNKIMFSKLQADLPEVKQENIIIETATRNTGPAMCLEVCYLEKFCSPNEVIASLPADDYISNATAFNQLLLASEDFLKQHLEYIITPAVYPQQIDTGYSYLKLGQELDKKKQTSIYQVADVVEKPNKEHCQKLISSGDYYCHAGMYVWQLQTISKLFQEFQPEMYQVCQQVVELLLEKEDFTKVADLYNKLEKISIESAITNKAEKVAMSVSSEFAWSDLGKWHILKSILSKPGDNLEIGQVFFQEAKNNLVYSQEKKKLIVLNDVDNLVVVDTGDVLLISSLEKSAEIKKIVEKLRENNKLKYL